MLLCFVIVVTKLSRFLKEGHCCYVFSSSYVYRVVLCLAQFPSYVHTSLYICKLRAFVIAV